MQTAYESQQSVEITSGDGYHEAVFSIGLKCTASSYAGNFDPRVAGEPPSGPEFEVTTIQVLVPQVNQGGSQTGALDSVVDLDPKQFEALVGEEIANYLYDRAFDEAAESGEF